MQQSAQLSYDTQVLLGALTGTLPASMQTSFAEIEGLRRRLNSGMSAMNQLKIALVNKGVPFPLTGKEDSMMTVFLLDMEGTLAPMPYSRNVMLPQIMGHMDVFIKRYFPGNGELAACLKAASAKSDELKQALEEAVNQNYTVPATNDKVRLLLLNHMKHAAETRNAMPYVKQFQADVWADAMEEDGGRKTTRVFSDSVDFVKCRGARGAQDKSRVFIYSTGSVRAQQTLLTHTEAGDLMPFISGLLDPSTMGSKLMPSSYSKIRSHISAVTGLRKDAFRIIFCTDSPSEASAADTSGSVDCSILVVRPGNDWVNIDTFLAVGAPHICSFAQLMDSVKPVDYDNLAVQVKDLIQLQSPVAGSG